MACILCLNYVAENDGINVYDYGEDNQVSGVDLIQKYIAVSEKILIDEVLHDPKTCLCRNCWVSLDTFHEFHNTISANYAVEEAFHKEEAELSTSDFIVYEDETYKEEMNDIKVEVLEEVEYTETEWIEEGRIVEIGPEEPKRELKIKSINPRIVKQPPVQLDSADDERIRRTAHMFCDVCQDPIESLREAKAHYKSAHSIDGYIRCCDRKFKQRCRLVEHVNTHYNFSYSCEICGKTFDSKSYLSKHQALHDGNKQFKCAHCPKAFSRKFQVRNHLLSVHIFENVEPSFICPVDGCDKKFVNYPRLKHHIDYTHSVNREVICEVCSKTFRTRNALDEHMRTHLRKEEDRIQCPVCKHFLADGKSFRRHLRNHETEHLDNICSHCGKKSPNLNALKKHIRYVHELNPTYQCRFCEKSFKRTRNLIDHEAAMHTLQDLYPCTFCERTFRNQSNMLAHRKKQHPDLYQKPKYMRDSV